MEGTGPVSAGAQVGGRPEAGGVEGTCGEGLADLVHLLSLASDLPPLPGDAACASAPSVGAEDVSLRRAVVFEVAAVARVNL